MPTRRRPAPVRFVAMSTAPGPVRLLASLALVAGLGLAAAACGSDGGAASDGGTEIGSPATAERGSTTTVAPAEPTEPTGLPDAAAAATELYDAWVADDRAAALTLADPAAVDAIFAATPGPYKLYRGCDTGEFDTGGCLFRDRSTNNTIQIDVEKRATGWVVARTFFSPR